MSPSTAVAARMRSAARLRGGSMAVVGARGCDSLQRLCAPMGEDYQFVRHIHRSVGVLARAAGSSNGFQQAPQSSQADSTSTSSSSKRRNSSSIPGNLDCDFDVVVVGGGLVGATFACLMATSPLTRHLRTAIVDRQPLKSPGAPPISHSFPDPRVIAVNPSSSALFQRLGIWSAIEADRLRCAPFFGMQVWDYSDAGFIGFSSEEARLPELGHIVETDLIVRSLHSRLHNLDSSAQVHVIAPARIASLEWTNHSHSSSPSPSFDSSSSSAISSRATTATSSSTPTTPDRAAQGSASAASASSSRSSSSSINSNSNDNDGVTIVEGELGQVERCGGASERGTVGRAPEGESKRETGCVELLLEDGRRIRTRLVVGADGANSQIRALAGLRCVPVPYNQRAVIATVQLASPNWTAWQRFLPTGPLALLPMGSDVSADFSNVVWSTTPRHARHLEGLSPLDFAREVNLHFQKSFSSSPSSSSSIPFPAWFPSLPSLLPSSQPFKTNSPSSPSEGTSSRGRKASGSFRLPPEATSVQGRVLSFPLTLRFLGRYTATANDFLAGGDAKAGGGGGGGVALIGDAAHTVHPLAGQGANLGFADCAALVEVIEKALYAGEDFVQASVLHEYERRRLAANSGMMATLHAIQRLFAATTPAAFPVARGAALSVLNHTPLLKQLIIQTAVGK